MKRIVSLVTVAALMATTLAVGASPAAAQLAITKDTCKSFEGLGGFPNQGQCIKAAKQYQAATLAE